jgi:hypothetical protein
MRDKPPTTRQIKTVIDGTDPKPIHSNDLFAIFQPIFDLPPHTTKATITMAVDAIATIDLTMWATADKDEKINKRFFLIEVDDDDSN